jgi:signal transduction histidine kinase
LRELARAENPELGGSAALSDIANQLRADHASLAIVLESDATLPISADNALIVFGHLADNAARHGAKQLSIGLEEDADVIRVRVRDDGAGVSPANREQIFEPFFTTRRDEGGTGMGLGIARALMRAHGGDIQLAETNAGAAFDLRFPRARA